MMRISNLSSTLTFGLRFIASLPNIYFKGYICMGLCSMLYIRNFSPRIPVTYSTGGYLKLAADLSRHVIIWKPTVILLPFIGKQESSRMVRALFYRI